LAFSLVSYLLGIEDNNILHLTKIMRLLVLFLFGVTFYYCLNAQQSLAQVAVAKIEFTSYTRGYQKEIFISPDSLIEIVEGRPQAENRIIKRKLAVDEWAALMKTLENVKLPEITDLQSPSTRRAFDGAKHSTIKIITSNGKAFEHTFDDENPHEKLLGLMQMIKKVESIPVEP
jgi:hypothetical protein